jgi:molecular chaperone GrpE
MANEDPTLSPDAAESDTSGPQTEDSAAQAGDSAAQAGAVAPTADTEQGDGQASRGGASDADASSGEQVAAPDSAASASDESASTPAPSGDAGDGPAEGQGSAQARPDPLAEAQRQRDEYLDLLRRERAEFENFRRRVARERAEAHDRGAERLVSSLLGVLDNFGFVLEAAKDSPDEALSKGTNMVYAELLDVLRKAGLQEVPGAGEPFDPNWHEAMLQVEPEEPVDAPVVAEVLRPGYRFKDRVLRPASVSVAQ